MNKDVLNIKSYQEKWNNEFSIEQKMRITSQADKKNNDGSIYYKDGNVDKAIEFFLYAFEIMPINDYALIYLVRCYNIKKQYRKAVESLKLFYHLSSKSNLIVNKVIAHSLLLHLIENFDVDGGAVSPFTVISFVKDEFELTVDTDRIEEVIRDINKEYNKSIIIWQIGDFAINLTESLYMTSDGVHLSTLRNEINKIDKLIDSAGEIFKENRSKDKNNPILTEDILPINDKEQKSDSFNSAINNENHITSNEIKSTEKTPNPPKKAEWWRRLIGWFIDTFPFAVFFTLAKDMSSDYWIAMSVIYLFWVLFYIIFEGVFNRTIGKLITRTIVLSNKTFRRPSFKQIIIRTFSRFIPFEAFSFLQNRPCGLHDSLSKTTVVTIKEKRLLQTGTTKLTMENANFFQRKILKLKSLGKRISQSIIIGSIIFPIILIILLKDDGRIENQEFIWILIALLSFAFYWSIVFFIYWLYVNRLKNNEIIVSSVVMGTLFALVLGFIFCNYYTIVDGVKIIVPQNYHSFPEFNYLLAMASFIVVSGITYLCLKKKNEKNTN